ncbi:MAG: sensor hybrid histidine kinase [Myxococcaceae bacterium]|nr:sensor hybrid histidine kinase [Myxococcaceae bacterium]
MPHLEHISGTPDDRLTVRSLRRIRPAPVLGSDADAKTERFSGQARACARAVKPSDVTAKHAQLPKAALRYGAALAAVALATLLKVAAGHWLVDDPQLAYLAAVCVAAWYGGARAGALATIAAAGAQMYFFIEPIGSFALRTPEQLVEIVGWLAEGMILCALWGAIDGARARAVTSAAEAAALAAEQKHLFETSPAPLVVLDASLDRITAVNNEAVRLYGYTRSELLSLRLVDLEVAEKRALVSAHRKKDGTVIQVETKTRTNERSDGVRLVTMLVTDITEKYRLEQQLRQAQKVEAMGLLAGGIAHDFNNVLNVLLTYADLAIETVASADADKTTLAEDLEAIREAGRSASDLAKQLLAFSRQERRVVKAVDVSEVVTGMSKILRVIGSHVRLVATTTARSKVKADPRQIEQVIMNLVVNARDAMPQGGKVTIETSDIEVGDAFAGSHPGIDAGAHVLLAVTDDGVGMDADVKAKIFEPFFTTKPKGQGTGLGLSTVFGIVHECGGAIDVKSAPGAGTSFSIYLPVMSERNAADMEES